MSGERMSVADYRKLGGVVPADEPSRRAAEPNPYRGLACTVCGAVVLTAEPARMHTDVLSGVVSVRHLVCGVDALTDGSAVSEGSP